MATEKHNEKAEWINDMTRELEGIEGGTKAKMLIELLKKTLKNISNWKTLGHDGIHGFWFKKFTFIHDRQELEMNSCYKMHKYQTGWQKEWPYRSKKTQVKELLQTIIDP